MHSLSINGADEQVKLMPFVRCRTHFAACLRWEPNCCRVSGQFIFRIHFHFRLTRGCKAVKRQWNCLGESERLRDGCFCCANIHADQIKISQTGENSIFTVVIAHFSVNKPRRGRTNRYLEAIRNEKVAGRNNMERESDICNTIENGVKTVRKICNRKQIETGIEYLPDHRFEYTVCLWASVAQLVSQNCWWITSYWPLIIWLIWCCSTKH